MSTSRLPDLARSLEPVPADPSDGTVPPRAGRVAATAVLLRSLDDGDLELVLTRRCDHLAHHPGQVAFPGGRVEPGESLVGAALREAAEEVALDPSTARPLGLLPGFYVPPSRFWLHPVVLHWQRPHPLHPAEAEVAEIFGVRLSRLTDRRRLRVVQLSARGASWAWDLDGGRVLWGATGVAVAELLDRLAPGWSAGLAPADLGSTQSVPRVRLAGPRGPRPARLAGLGALPERTVAQVPRPEVSGFNPRFVPGAARAVASAAQELLAVGGRRVAVLAGPGGTGRVGWAAALDLARRGYEVVVVPTAAPPAGVDRALRRAGAGVQAPGTTALPPHDLVIDALLGRGFAPPLRGAIAQLVPALHGSAALQLAVDLPTGLDPVTGPVGPAVAADVTVVVVSAPSLLEVAGAEPFVGDCYLWRPGQHSGHDPGLGLERLLLR